MKGDRLFCVACGKYSVDTNNMYDSRKSGKPNYIAPKKWRYIWNCPHCLMNDIVNVNQTIKNSIKLIDDSKGYLVPSIYYKFINDWPKLREKALNSQDRSIKTEENDND